MHALLCAKGDEQHLHDELRRLHPGLGASISGPGIVLVEEVPFRHRESAGCPPVFLRQSAFHATWEKADSIRAWGDRIWDQLQAVFREDVPWRLHVLPLYGDANAGVHRCELIQANLRDRLRRQRRGLLRLLTDSHQPFSEGESLIQVLLNAPDAGVLSMSRGPEPCELHRWISPHPLGCIPIAVDKAAPSRAFSKLVEAGIRLALPILPDTTCVDLGASPGSWSYRALQQGARIVAVDRAELRAELMRHPRLSFIRGDAFRYQPDQVVDWLLCDVIAAPERTSTLLVEWLEQRWCRQFVVTFKFKGDKDYPILDPLREILARHCDSFILTRLCANHNEVCAAGRVKR